MVRWFLNIRTWDKWNFLILNSIANWEDFIKGIQITKIKIVIIIILSSVNWNWALTKDILSGWTGNNDDKNLGLIWLRVVYSFLLFTINDNSILSRAGNTMLSSLWGFFCLEVVLIPSSPSSSTSSSWSLASFWNQEIKNLSKKGNVRVKTSPLNRILYG